jgi:hypothetical protein
MNNSFCTLITPDYYPYSLAILNSLEEHSSQPVILEVFITANVIDKSFFHLKEKINLKFNFIEDIKNPIAEELYKKYNLSYMDGYRWSMKPVFINYLLEKKLYDKVIYLDSDLFFYNDPQFLFELLDVNRVILTPHWRCADKPEKDLINFKWNFTDGIYNAGFIGVNKSGIEVMNFWANLCRVACEVNHLDGLHDDQKYLDILHSRFDGIGVVRHKGCNVADWNLTDCERIVDIKGNVLINGEYPIIFIHFTFSMMVNILSGIDIELLEHFLIYSKTINRFANNIDLLDKANRYIFEKQNNLKNDKKSIISIFIKIIKKLRIKLILKKIINWTFK